jgi:hypothetical protein
VHHALTRSRKGLANARAQTMMPLIRNVLFVAIFIIALIVALANMGMNVTPLLAGAGVIGLAIGFGAQSLVADLITGLFIIIEDSLAIDDYVDVGGHLGTVEGLTIRTVRLRDIDGIVHTIPFSEIKSIKNYSRDSATRSSGWRCLQHGYRQRDQTDARGRPENAHRSAATAQHLVAAGDSGCGKLRVRQRDSARPLQDRADQTMGSVRAFNLLLKRHLDEAGMDLATRG